MNRVIGITAAMLFSVTGNMASAASQNECAIWICLPGGFPSGCGAAHSAMKNRIKHKKPPLPGFGECAVSPPRGSGSHMSFDWGIAAYIPSRFECVRWDGYGGDNGESCAQYNTVPERYVRGRYCNHGGDGNENPRFCTKTVRWSEVFIEDKLAGPTYYW